MGGVDSSRVFDYSQGGRIYVAVVSDSCSPKDCRRLADSCQEYLQCKVVVYYSEPCPITQLSKQRLFWEQADRDNVTRMVPVIENISQLAVEGKSVALDVSQIQELIRQGKSLEAVNTVRKAVEAARKAATFLPRPSTRCARTLPKRCFPAWRKNTCWPTSCSKTPAPRGWRRCVKARSLT